MNPIPSTFGRPRVLLPVIHPTSRDAAMRALDVARESGADGVFLIDQGMEAEDVLWLLADRLRDQPDFWLGMNWLGRPPQRVVEEFFDYVEYGSVLPGGVWSDRAEALMDRGRWCGLYFGGVAFKYQPQPVDLREAVRLARADGVDVVTTSGPATGQPASLDKVLRFREALGDRPLALASGVSAGNVRAFLPHVDAFLVASSIERGFGVLDPDKVRQLADLVHGWSP